MNSKSNKRVVINMVAITFLLMFIIAGLTLEPILAGKDVPSCKVDEDCSVLVHVSTNVTVSCGESGLCECDHTLNIENDNMQVIATNAKADEHFNGTGIYSYKCSFLINETCSGQTCPEAAGCTKGVCKCIRPSMFGTYHKNDMNMCYWPAKSPRKYGELCDPTPDDGLRRCDVSVNNTGYDCHTVEGEEYGRCTCPPETPLRGTERDDKCFAYPELTPSDADFVCTDSVECYGNSNPPVSEEGSGIHCNGAGQCECNHIGGDEWMFNIDGKSTCRRLLLQPCDVRDQCPPEDGIDCVERSDWPPPEPTTTAAPTTPNPNPTTVVPETTTTAPPQKYCRCPGKKVPHAGLGRCVTAGAGEFAASMLFVTVALFFSKLF